MELHLARDLPWKLSFCLMIDFTKRSYQKEYLDRDDLLFSDISLNMKELEFINSKLGGHSITLDGFKTLAQRKNQLSVCEVGSGGGDNLRVIYDYAKKNNISLTCMGIDINPNCIRYARERIRIPGINFINADYLSLNLKDRKPDIIFCSLFTHHFNESELLEMIQWMKENSNLGFFINDLHRHPIAYYFIRLATIIFSRSYLVKHDAPLSVLRGFVRKEWELILKSARINNYAINWKWAFRYLVTVKNHKGNGD